MLYRAIQSNRLRNFLFSACVILIVGFLSANFWSWVQQESAAPPIISSTTLTDSARFPDINFTDSPRPRMLSPSNGQETQHVCLGGEDELREYGPLTRHCVFKNMCYNVSTQQWLYYAGSKHIPRVVGVHKGNRLCTENCEAEDQFIYTDFESANVPFVNIRFEIRDRESVTPVVVNDRIPDKAFFDLGKTKSTIHAYAMYPGSWADAIGHILAEEIYPVFHGLDLVGVRDRDVQLLIPDSPCPDGKKCPVFYEAMKSITKHHPNISNMQKNFSAQCSARNFSSKPCMLQASLHGKRPATRLL